MWQQVKLVVPLNLCQQGPHWKMENGLLQCFQGFAAFLRQSCALSRDNSLQTHNEKIKIPLYHDASA